MKKLLLILVMFSTSIYRLSAADYTTTITMMIGKSATINPVTDVGLTLSNTCKIYQETYEMYYNNVYDNSAFTITPIDNAYKIEALRTGTFRMDVKVTWFNPKSQYLIYTTYIATYNINVIDVTQINMPSSLNLQPGSTYTLTPQILETGATSELTWTSSNTGVAIVSNVGVIRALRVGTTDITCTAYNGVSATCRITVVPIIAEDFVLEETLLELEQGETATLSPIFTPANTTDQSVTYKSSNTKVATVDAEGLVTGVGKGTCTITASTNDGSGLNAACTITVKPTVTSITLQNAMELTVGQNNILEPVILEEGAVTTLTWHSSNTSVATVTSDGTVYAASAGKTTVTCTAANGVSASCEVTVNPLPNYLYSSNISVIVGSQATLPIMMANKEKITACAFEIVLPEGVTISSYQLTERKADQSVGVEQLANGNHQVVIFSSTSTALNGTDGVLLNLALTADMFMSTGTYVLGIKNIELTTTDALTINPVDVNVALTVSDVQIGDANGDGKISITDAVAIVNSILGNASANFVNEAADVNGDGKVSITDAVAVVNKVLKSGTVSAKVRMKEEGQLDPQ